MNTRMSFRTVDKGILKSLQHQIPEQPSATEMEKCAFEFKLCLKFLAVQEVNNIVESYSRSRWEVKEEGDADSFP